MKNIRIKKLSKKYLEETISLLNLIFPVQDEEENADTCLRASLDTNSYKMTLEKWSILKLEYFIAVTDDDKVIATSGIYEMAGDKNSGWVGWTSVHPDFRRRGIGKKMLKETLEEIKSRGYKFAKLHTVDIEDQKNAHKLYEKMGFKLIDREIGAEIGHDRLYYVVEL